MATPAHDRRGQLVERRERIAGFATRGGAGPQLEGLLRDVDDALERLAAGTYGHCETCHEPIEADRLDADPLIRFCLDHLSPIEARALEHDLELAASVQRTLLPPAHLIEHGWEMAYHYQPLGTVSGDYCDAVRPATAEGDLVLLLGDISGKGVAASMLMAHLHASVRTLVGLGLPLPEVMARANRLFCESTMANHYATLVCARFGRSGTVDVCNAGHCPPLLVRRNEVVAIEATSVPLGLFCVRDYLTRPVTLGLGETLVLYTDGVTEARNHADEEYGEDRLRGLVAAVADKPPQSIVAACVQDLATFRGRAKRADDVTLMAVRRVA